VQIKRLVLILAIDGVVVDAESAPGNKLLIRFLATSVNVLLCVVTLH
jgi:hypothetical protein